MWKDAFVLIHEKMKKLCIDRRVNISIFLLRRYKITDETEILKFASAKDFNYIVTIKIDCQSIPGGKYCVKSLPYFRLEINLVIITTILSIGLCCRIKENKGRIFMFRENTRFARGQRNDNILYYMLLLKQRDVSFRPSRRSDESFV